MRLHLLYFTLGLHRRTPAILLRYSVVYVNMHPPFKTTLHSSNWTSSTRWSDSTSVLEIRWQTTLDYLNEEEKKWLAMHHNGRNHTDDFRSSSFGAYDQSALRLERCLR